MVINQMELDQPKNMQALEKLLSGIEAMKPKMVVCIGPFFSEQVLESETFDDFKKYFEQLGQIVKEKMLVHLRDEAEWIFVPSGSDPG